MRTIGACVVLCFCLLMAAGFASYKWKSPAEDELAEFQSDTNMVVSDWYRKGYFILEFDGHFYWLVNSIFLKMLGFHVLIWIVATFYIMSRTGAITDREGLFLVTYFGSYVVLLALSLAFWMVGGILISNFLPDRWIPFDFLAFLTLVGTYAAIAAYLASMAIGRIGKRGGEMEYQPSSARVVVVGVPRATRRGRVLRAMMKSLFVAVASAIGGKIGGWIGGVLVFVISAGVSTWFELPSDLDPSHHHEPPSPHP
jgi:hypothetical protein